MTNNANTVLTITVTPEGRMSVTGPIDNKILAYGLLDAARDVIKDHNDKPKSPILQPTKLQINGG